MSPSRDRGRGTLIVDRHFPGLGRVKRASGTNDKAVFKLMQSMLDLLLEKGKLDYLRGWAERRYSLLELYDAYLRGDLESLASATTVQRLWRTDENGREVGVVAMRLAKWKQSTTHLRSTKLTFARLRELSPVVDGQTTATLNHLPALLLKYREKCEDEKHAVSYNLARAHCMALAKRVVGKGSYLHKAIQNTDMLPVEKTRRTADSDVENEGRALELTEAWRVHQALARVGPAYAAVWRTMLCTGMGPSELRGRWTVASPDGRVARVRIDGTKRAMRKRAVPFVVPWGPLERPTLSMRQFSAVLRGATGGEIQPYDARRTFSHLLSLARIERARQLAYMGHKAKDVNDVYEKHNVEPHLEADAAAVLALFNQFRLRREAAE